MSKNEEKRKNKEELPPFARDVVKGRKKFTQYTQEKAAEVLEVSSRRFQEYESGEGLPRLKRAMKMSLIFHFSLDALAAEMEESGELEDLD